ncbi:MAG: 23S rRNA (pseudouridine(1915)-N(3))-methyltransferase RlmH [bacterium]
MAITILTVGKKQSDEWSALSDEYIKRIRGFDALKIKYIKDSGELRDDKKTAIREESERIISEIKDYDRVYLLDRKGEMVDSEEFSTILKNQNIAFIIGGSWGVDEKVANAARRILSFSKMTFPHRLFRVILLEQIYRGFTIRNNMRYHK